MTVFMMKLVMNSSIHEAVIHGYIDESIARGIQRPVLVDPFNPTCRIF